MLVNQLSGSASLQCLSNAICIKAHFDDTRPLVLNTNGKLGGARWDIWRMGSYKIVCDCSKAPSGLVFELQFHVDYGRGAEGQYVDMLLWVSDQTEPIEIASGLPMTERANLLEDALADARIPMLECPDDGSTPIELLEWVVQRKPDLIARKPFGTCVK